MTKVRHQLIYHFVWATKNRLPLITAGVEERLFPHIRSKCRELGYRLEAVNGVEDHIHVLMSLPPTVAPSQAAKRLKGASPHFVNKESGLDTVLYWQRGYGVSSVGEQNLPAVRRYVHCQKERHQSTQGLDSALEQQQEDKEE